MEPQSYRPHSGRTDYRLLSQLDSTPSQQSMACYVVPHGHPLANSARGIESAVFREFFGNDPATMQAAYEPYEAASTWLLVVDSHLRRAAGTIRVIKHSAAGLKTLVDVSRPPLGIPTFRVLEQHRLDLAKTWDIGTLAVLPEYRGDHLVASELYGQLYALGRRNRIKHAVTVLDDHAYQQLVTVLGVPWVPMCGSEPGPYLGSAKSHAVVAEVDKMAPASEKHVASLPVEMREVVGPLARRIFRGEGLAAPICLK